MKRLGFAVVHRHHGLTLTDLLAEFFCEIKLDFIMFSIDSTTPETLKKVRGVDKLDKIEDAVRRMMEDPAALARAPTHRRLLHQAGDQQTRGGCVR